MPGPASRPRRQPSIASGAGRRSGQLGPASGASCVRRGGPFGASRPRSPSAPGSHRVPGPSPGAERARSPGSFGRCRIPRAASTAFRYCRRRTWPCRHRRSGCWPGPVMVGARAAMTTGRGEVGRSAGPRPAGLIDQARPRRRSSHEPRFRGREWSWSGCCSGAGAPTSNAIMASIASGPNSWRLDSRIL